MSKAQQAIFLHFYKTSFQPLPGSVGNGCWKSLSGVQLAGHSLRSSANFNEQAWMIEREKGITDIQPMSASNVMMRPT